MRAVDRCVCSLGAAEKLGVWALGCRIFTIVVRVESSDVAVVAHG